ncbi:MAG: hypothetical protein Q9178_007133 [Gyalolechia marmorata]
MRDEAAGHSSPCRCSDGSPPDEQGGPQGALSTPLSSVPDLEARTLSFCEQANLSISVPPSRPPPSDAVLSSIPATQTESSNITLQNIGPGPSRDKRNGNRTTPCATTIRDPPKRTASIAELNKKGEGAPTTEKIRRTDDSDKAIGDSQDNPLVLEDDDGKLGETGGSTRATSVKSEIRTTHPPSLYTETKPKNPRYSLNTSTIHDLSIEPIDRPTSPIAALAQHPYERVIGEDHYGGAAAARLLSAITPSFSSKSQAQNTALKEQE